MSIATHAALHGEDISIAVTSCGHNLGCGCEGISNCCFKCPLKHCRFEVVGGLRALQNVDRNKDIINLRSRGESVANISEQFELSRTTVGRIVRYNG